MNLQAIGQNAVAALQRMTGPQRVTLALAFAATALGVFLVARSTASSPMSTLYADLDPSVAADVTAELERQGVPYELTGGGRIIQVPSSQVYQARLDLAGQGLPGSSSGWPILDDQSITSTAFQQRIAYQRAMEGELARTISAIDAVRSADVHLVIPENDLIVDDGKQASASVLVNTGGGSISPMQVQAVVNLVASSVEGLATDQVSVVDEAGRVLAAPGGATAMLDLQGDARFRARLDYEAMLENDLETLLATIVGPGLAVVSVSTELDFDAVTTTTEEHKPLESADGGQLLLNRTTRNELYRDDAAATEEGGELAIELPDDITVDGGAEGVDQGVKYVLDERDEIYAVDKVITTSQNSPGAVTSLSVAVLLDENGVDADRVADIESLVGAAVGLNTERGDTLAVTLMPINESVKASIEEAAAAAELTETGGGLDLVGLIRTVGTIVVALLVVLLGIRFLARTPRRRVIDSIDLNELDAGGALALGPGSSESQLDEGEPPEIKLQSLIANQTDDVAGVLRAWLNEADEVARS
jgi:flagellar M-ring protein FliF